MGYNVSKKADPMQESAFAKQPIDGNEVIRQMMEERNRTKTGEGQIVNHDTGQVLAQAAGMPGIEAPQQVIPEGFTAEDWNEKLAIYKNMGMTEEEALADEQYVIDNVMSYAESEADYAQRHGDSPDYKTDMTGDEEFEARRKETLNNMGDVSNFMEQNHIDFDSIYNELPKDIDKEVLDMLMDPRKMKSIRDQEDTSLALDGVLDVLGVDAEKYFQEGIMETCGAECQDRRELMEAQALEMDDAEFTKRYASLGD